MSEAEEAKGEHWSNTESKIAESISHPEGWGSKLLAVAGTSESTRENLWLSPTAAAGVEGLC